MTSLALALKKANVVTDDDLERVERQKRIEAEKERERKEKIEIKRMIALLHPMLREAVKNIRRENPDVMTITVLQKLVAAKVNPMMLMDADVVEAMGHTMLETIRLDLERAKSENGNGKRD